MPTWSSVAVLGCALLGCSLLGCSSKKEEPASAPVAPPPAVAPAAGAATAPATGAVPAPPAPAAGGVEVAAVPLAIATFSEGQVVPAGTPPSRVEGCRALAAFEEGHQDPCAPGRIPGGSATGLAAPWSTADVLRIGQGAGGDDSSTACGLVVVAKDTAYVARDWLAPCHDGDGIQAAVTWAVHDVVPGGAPELVLDVVRDTHQREDGELTRSEDVKLRAWCGIGASGTPSCTAPVELAKAASARPRFP